MRRWRSTSVFFDRSRLVISLSDNSRPHILDITHKTVRSELAVNCLYHHHHHHHHQTRSNQPKRPIVVIVGQNSLSSASSRAFVAVTPVSWQIWWIQVVSGRPLACLHSCEGRSLSLVLVQIQRIWFAGASLQSLATWPKRPSLHLRTM